MIEELLTAARETRTIMPTDKTRERALPVDGEAFETLQKFPI
jgi:hypothetical protein